MSGRRFAWVLGWAIPPEWFEAIVRRAFPTDAHVLVEPAANSWTELEAAAPFDRVVGYSLGSLLLLQDPQRASQLGKISLLAPIWGFPAEAGCGGKISRANLRALTRAYRANPETALNSFRATAALSGSSGIPAAFSPSALAERQPTHLWGLQQLDRVIVPAVLPADWNARIGSEDSLLDARRIEALVPGVEVIPAATHHPAELIAAFAASVR